MVDPLTAVATAITTTAATAFDLNSVSIALYGQRTIYKGVLFI